MLHPARVMTFLIALALGLVLRHFVGDVTPTDDTDESPSASALARQNTPIAHELTRRWSMMPQVEEAHAGYVGGDDYGVVIADAVCGRCNRKNLLNRLTRDIWVSEMEGLTSFKVRVAREGERNRPLTRTWNVRRDARVLYDKYGNGLVDPAAVK